MKFPSFFFSFFFCGCVYVCSVYYGCFIFQLKHILFIESSSQSIEKPFWKFVWLNCGLWLHKERNIFYFLFSFSFLFARPWCCQFISLLSFLLFQYSLWLTHMRRSYIFFTSLFVFVILHVAPPWLFLSFVLISMYGFFLSSLFDFLSLLEVPNDICIYMRQNPIYISEILLEKVKY